MKSTLTIPSTTSTTTTSSATIKMNEATTYYPIVESSTKVTFFPDNEEKEQTTINPTGRNKEPKTLAAKTEQVHHFTSLINPFSSNNYHDRIVHIVNLSWQLFQDYNDEYLLNKIYDDVSNIYDDLLDNSESDKSSSGNEGIMKRFLKR